MTPDAGEIADLSTPPSSDPPAPWGRWWRTGWLPAGLLIAGLALTLHAYSVGWADLSVYGLYLAGLIVLPGTLIWRAVTRRAYAFGEEVAAGTAVGLALEVLAYIPARAIGAPLLVIAASVTTIAAFLVSPGLRRHWRPGRGAGRMPAWYSWALTVILGLIVVYMTATHLRDSDPYPPTYGIWDSDSPWYLAVIGELKNHIPPQIPYGPLGPLYYHWFAFADMAATSHVTGIEPLILLRRLSILPYIAVLALVVAAIARRVVGRWWAGPAAALASFFLVAPHPYGWVPQDLLTTYGFGLVEDGSLLRYTLWYGPPQSLGAALFAALALLLIGVLRGEHRGVPAWILTGALVVATAGSKITYLALLLAGLACVVLISLVRRSVNRPALGVAAITVGGFAVAYVLVGGTASGLKLAPFSVLVDESFAQTGVLAEPRPALAIAALLGVYAVGWACVWGGVFALGSRAVLQRPDVVLFGGLGLAGLGGTLAFSHPGLSQVAFVQGARPYLCILAVLGLATLVDPDAGRAMLAKIAAAAGAGVVTLAVLRSLSSSTMPHNTGAAGSRAAILIALLWPYALIVTLVVATAVVLWRMPRTRASATVLALSAFMGMGLEASLHDKVATPVRVAATEGWSVPKGGLVTPGLPEAARWLRDHSEPGDVVATNAHCALPGDVCNNARFLAAAFTERRILIEGWGYTITGERIAKEWDIPHFEVPYWGDPTVLADNDAAFRTPSAQTVGRLRDAYGVRWLLVDRTQTPPSADLALFAELRYSGEWVDIYEIAPAD